MCVCANFYSTIFNRPGFIVSTTLDRQLIIIYAITYRVSSVMAIGDYTCHFITKLSIIAELKEYFKKEIKAQIKTHTDEIWKEIAQLKQTSKELSSAAATNIRQSLFGKRFGVWTLLFYPFHWMATKLSIAGPSDQSEKIRQQDERIEQLDKRVTGQATLQNCLECLTRCAYTVAYDVLHVFFRVHKIPRKILSPMVTPHITVSQFVFFYVVVELEEKDFYNIKVQKG